MPNRIIRDAILDSERYLSLTHHVERLLVFELILLADDYGLVPMGHAFLVRRTTACNGMTPEQTTRVIQALSDVDLIRVFVADSGSRFAYLPRFGNAPRAKKPKWPMPPDALGGNEIKNLQQKRVAHAQHLHANAPETETETETETENTPPIVPRRESAPSALDVRFDRFWSVYPKKIGKDAARKAFAKRRPSEALTAEMIVAVTAQKQTEQWRRDGGQFVPNPATWLNQGRWQDDAGPAKAEAGIMSRAL